MTIHGLVDPSLTRWPFGDSLRLNRAPKLSTQQFVFILCFYCVVDIHVTYMIYDPPRCHPRVGSRSMSTQHDHVCEDRGQIELGSDPICLESQSKFFDEQQFILIEGNYPNNNSNKLQIDPPCAHRSLA